MSKRCSILNDVKYRRWHWIISSHTKNFKLRIVYESIHGFVHLRNLRIIYKTINSFLSNIWNSQKILHENFEILWILLNLKFPVRKLRNDFYFTEPEIVRSKNVKLLQSGNDLLFWSVSSDYQLQSITFENRIFTKNRISFFIIKNHIFCSILHRTQCRIRVSTV